MTPSRISDTPSAAADGASSRNGNLQKLFPPFRRRRSEKMAVSLELWPFAGGLTVQQLQFYISLKDITGGRKAL